MRNIKRIISFGLCCAVITASSIGAQQLGAMASGKGANVKAQSYGGMIRRHKANTWLDKAYRDTTKAEDPVLVKLEKSNEGEDLGKFVNTRTRFWIEDINENNLSLTTVVTEGTEYYEIAPYQKASKKTVYLTAEDNEDTDHIYKISGKWKEE